MEPCVCYFNNPWPVSGTEIKSWEEIIMERVSQGMVPRKCKITSSLKISFKSQDFPLSINKTVATYGNSTIKACPIFQIYPSCLWEWIEEAGEEQLCNWYTWHVTLSGTILINIPLQQDTRLSVINYSRSAMIYLSSRVLDLCLLLKDCTFVIIL